MMGSASVKLKKEKWISKSTLQRYVNNVKAEGFFFILKSSLMSWLALSDSFEYLCYGFIAISLFTLTVRGWT